MTLYASASDVYAYGAPRGALYAAGRLVSAVSAAADTLTIEGHALAADTPVQVFAEPGDTLPGGLSASTVYYAQPVSGSTSLLQLATTEGGSAVDITSAGSGNISLTENIDAIVEKWSEHYSRKADRMAQGHEVPFTAPYPVTLVLAVAIATADHVVHVILRRRDDDLADRARRAWSELSSELRQGAPLRDAIATDGRRITQAWGNGRRNWGPGEDRGRVL